MRKCTFVLRPINKVRFGGCVTHFKLATTDDGSCTEFPREDDLQVAELDVDIDE
jgi:hypothetical protein